MKNPKNMTAEELKRALATRIKKRPYGTRGSGAEVCYLDLRGKAWNLLGTHVIRDPAAPDWPDGGETTDQLATAKAWMQKGDQYADWIARQLRGEDTELTVAEGIEPFIQAMHDDPYMGPDHSTVSQRRSYLRRHVMPGLGKHRLLTLSRDAVQGWLNSMEIEKTQNGVPYRQAASKNTKKAARATLVALFHHHFPGVPVPFAGTKIESRKAAAAYRRALVKQGRGRELVKRSTYTPDEVRIQLLTARYIDLHPEIGVVPVWACRTLAPLIAVQLGFAARIAELVEVRWGDIDDEDGFAFVAGTKSANALRYMPLQMSIRPWLQILRSAQAPPHYPEHYVLRMRPDQDAAPVKDVWARRMAYVQRIAGLKLEGQRSHIYRRTHSSTALMAGIPPHEVKLLLGHTEVAGGATDEYIEFIRQLTRPEHREYIDLPTPEEVDAILAGGWEPPHLPRRRRG